MWADKFALIGDVVLGVLLDGLIVLGGVAYAVIERCLRDAEPRERPEILRALADLVTALRLGWGSGGERLNDVDDGESEEVRPPGPPVADAAAAARRHPERVTEN